MEEFLFVLSVKEKLAFLVHGQSYQEIPFPHPCVKFPQEKFLLMNINVWCGVFKTNFIDKFSLFRLMVILHDKIVLFYQYSYL